MLSGGCGFADGVGFLFGARPGQDNQLDKVHIPRQGLPRRLRELRWAEAPAATGTNALKIRPGSRIRMNVDMVLIPVTVTDP